MRIAFEEVWRALRLISTLVALALVEAFARGLGTYDYYIKGDKQVVWDMAWSTKKVETTSPPTLSVAAPPEPEEKRPVA